MAVRSELDPSRSVKQKHTKAIIAMILIEEKQRSKCVTSNA